MSRPPADTEQFDQSDSSDEVDGDEASETPLEPIDISNPDVIATARRRHGLAGAALAAGMFGLDIALGNKKKPDSVQVQESPTEPEDVDADGIQLTVDANTTVTAPALERLPPVVLSGRKPRRR